MTKKEQAEAGIGHHRQTNRPRADKKRITLVIRDRGCGITPTDVPQGIFHVGSKHKDGYDWQQGTFGMGGATTYRNAKARNSRHPSAPGSAGAQRRGPHHGRRGAMGEEANDSQCLLPRREPVATTTLDMGRRSPPSRSRHPSSPSSNRELTWR